MTDALSRRAALKALVTATGAVGAIAVLPAERVAAAAAAAAANAATAGKPHVSPKDATAIALAYVEDASKVDPKKFPNYKAGQDCVNCLQSNGGANDPWRNCNLFPGKLVSSKGWCKVYVKRP